MSNINNELAKNTPVYKEELEVLKEQLPAAFGQDPLDVFYADAERMGEAFTNPLKLAVGDNAPLFSLPNATGEQISLQDYLNKGAVVITFYRGSWCPFCNLVLNGYQRVLPEIKNLGANLIAISPQTPDNSLTIKEKNELKFEVLSDIGNHVAKQYVQIFENSAASTNELLNAGIDLREFNDAENVELPVPGVFIIDQTGKVIFAKSEGGDYRNRVEAEEILNALQELSRR
ncbi:MAG: peroxiredoxin-like family protein [Mucilaginibacter sp.]|jgi:peroxiredoxin|uniref:peroxiredoxin-like family protein n=1 Tax=Mucilaginibacter sp. TaxID=1882438 RepID=UPI003567730B